MARLRLKLSEIKALTQGGLVVSLTLGSASLCFPANVKLLRVLMSSYICLFGGVLHESIISHMLFFC